ncbi:MAG TPA: MFS transporter [Alphaproteobacteria bacterium]|nr:MFS transporter [Alphaproteobacteria bacterium]
MTDTPSSGQPDARAVATSLLRTVLRRRQSFDSALTSDSDFAALHPRDKAFARLITATTFRRLGQIDALIAGCLDNALPDEASPVQDILRIGVAQLAFIGTPAHAAVDRTVALVRGRRIARYRALVNAVLRRISREAAGLIDEHDAARLNTPDWLWQAWSEAHGEETCRRIAACHLGEAPLDITVKGEAAAWAEKLNAEQLPTGSLRRVAGGRIEDLAGYADGGWWIQDAAAALPARVLMAAYPEGVAGRCVADLCAAPGGKTAQLAAGGACVSAVDLSAARIALLSDNLDRLGLDASLVVSDAATWRPDGLFDAVLLDAPCSGTGTIRRRPDIARLKSPEDVERLALLQRRLLDAASGLVAPGGLLVYAVCSLQPEEGEAQITAFQERGAPFVRQPITSTEIGGLDDAVTPSGDIMTLPCHLSKHGGLDGFYVARLRAMKADTRSRYRATEDRSAVMVANTNIAPPT